MPRVSAPDVVLLDRFVFQRDQAAFTALVTRHGPMVLNVCRRVLGDAHHAANAFQAAFLVLARKAPALERNIHLAAWLYGVAYRVALKARRAVGRLRGMKRLENADELPDLHPQPPCAPADREWWSIFEQELQRLPQDYRLPVVLCCLEGLTHQETAQRLGWTTGSVKGRLERGRARLQARLVRRGLTLPATLVILPAARAEVTAALVGRTVQAGLATICPGASLATIATTPFEVLQLADDFLNGNSMFKLKIVVVLALLTALTAFAVSGLNGQDQEDKNRPRIKVAVDLSDGSRVVGQPAGLKELLLRASFGEVRIPIEQVESVQLKDDKGTAMVRFGNGDQLSGVLDLKALGDLKIATALGDTTVPLKSVTLCKIEALAARVNVTARASSSGEQTDPSHPFEPPGKVSRWNSGGYAPGWIEADLGAVKRLETIALVTSQTPAGETLHEIWVSELPIGEDRSKAKMVHAFRGETDNAQELTHAFAKETNGRYVQIRTVISPSWVGWTSIELRAR